MAVRVNGSLQSPHVPGLYLRHLVVRRGADQEGVTAFVGRVKLVYALSTPVLLLAYFLGVGCGLPWRSGYG